MLWRKSFLCGVIPTGRKSQRKGADGERELAALLREYGYPVERGGSLSFGEVPDLTGLPGVHIECKRDAVRFGDGLPAVFFRRSRSPWLVVMKLGDWLELYQTQSEPRKTAPSE